MRCAFFQRRFTRPHRPRRYWAYHDEILPDRGRQAHPFLVHGVLFVEESSRRTVCEKLHELRQGYIGEVHHRELKGTQNEQFQVASRWLAWFKGEGLRYFVVKVFAADQQGFKSLPYPGDAEYFPHLWQSTLTSFVAGIRWGLPETRSLLISIVCDETDNDDFRAVAADLPSALARDMRRRRAKTKARQAKSQRRVRLAPRVRVVGPVRFVSSSPSSAASVDADHSELLQLTDLILGTLWDAIEGRTVRSDKYPGRRALAVSMRGTDEGKVLLPWASRLPIARRISVSMWPDERNRAYSPSVLRPRPGQQPLAIWSQVELRKREKRPVEFEEPETPAGIAPVDGLAPRRRRPLSPRQGSPAHPR